MNILISHLKTNIKEIKLPEIDIIEVSRLATFAPSLQEISIKEMMRVWNLYSTQSISSLFKTLNVAPETFQSFIDKYGIPADEQINIHGRTAVFSNFLTTLVSKRRSGSM